MPYTYSSLRPTRVSGPAVVMLFVFGGLLFPIATRQAAQTRRSPRIVTGLTDVIYAVRFSLDSQTLAIAPDGRTLVTASGGFHRDRIAEKPSAHDGRSFTELKWWDAQNGELKQRVELRGEDLVSVAALYSPNGKMLAAFEQRAEPKLTMIDSRSPLGDPDNL